MIAHRPTATRTDGQRLEKAAHRFLDLCSNLSHNGMKGTVLNPGMFQLQDISETWNCEHQFMASFVKLLQYTHIRKGNGALPFK